MRSIFNLQKNVLATPSKQPVIVTSNCQTHGIANSFSQIFDWPTVPIWKLEGLEFVIAELRNRAEKNFIWISSFNSTEAIEISKEAGVQLGRHINIPEIFFDAFHPDMTYLQNNKLQYLNSPLGDTHSRIILYGYFANLSVDQTLNLFNEEVFFRLGYISNFESSLQNIKIHFQNSDIEIDAYLDGIVHRPPFMHSFNHPKIDLLTAIAENCGLKLGLSPKISANEYAQKCIDNLFQYGTIWPIYPEIAKYYGEEGSYLWRKADGSYLSLGRFVEESIIQYKSIELKEEDVNNFISKDILRYIRETGLN